ncbi:MAG: class I SAM-dependent methyltransferase [Solirubrobacteraceae bacterium]|nr:class I SAM-dependent methyltransferase [Solirubrobacteraceae bacterium]
MGQPREFAAPAEHYDRFMGRFTRTLAPAFIGAAGIGPGDGPVVDVGCGPGGLTLELAKTYGGEAIAAIDPADQFAAACRDRVPGADVRVGGAEELPWDDDAFGAALACLVIGFMRDPVRGISEMARVTRPGGTVAACMWHLPEGMPMLGHFWKAMLAVRPELPGERALVGTQEGQIGDVFRTAGLIDVREGSIAAAADYTGFDDYWEPLTNGVGPAGQALAALPEADRERVRDTAKAGLPDGPFTLEARAWLAVGTVA